MGDDILLPAQERCKKPMRLVLRMLRNAAYFRREPVFLSANPLNIEVFRAIANHNVLCRGVTEII